MAQGAVPRRRHGFRRCRFGRQLNRQGPGWGTVMRHFLLPSPVTALPFGVGVTTAQAVLIATAGGSNRTAAGLLGTPRGAVAMAAITVAANEHRGAAAGA